jgi:hypothetical protein
MQQEGLDVGEADRADPAVLHRDLATSPAGVAMRTVVTGSTAATMPAATTVVAVPMMQCPHIGTYSSCSIMTTAKSASSASGGISRTEHIMPWPRGSN